MELCDLLFELSSSQRMDIILILRTQRMRLSHLAQRLEMSIAEASRQLQRLSEAQLISKSEDGTFSPTLFGELAISLLSGLNFISENREYFLEHIVSNIPNGFVNRLGELSSSTFEIDAVKVQARVTEMLQKAEDYIWAITYQHLPYNVKIVEDRIQNGINFRGIFPDNIELPLALLPVIRTRKLIELRILVTEKEAMTGFTHLNGVPQYSAFFSQDPKCIEWCKEIHSYYWGSSKPATVN